MGSDVRHLFGRSYLAEVRSRLTSTGLKFIFALAALLGAFSVAPMLLGPVAERSEPNPVDRLYAAHRCASAAGAGRPMLLISTPAGGAELIKAATTGDELGAQTDWLYDQRADFYGWCER